jgi:hypothetical protein
MVLLLVFSGLNSAKRSGLQSSPPPLKFCVSILCHKSSILLCGLLLPKPSGRYLPSSMGEFRTCFLAVVSGETPLPGCTTRRRRQDLVQYVAWTWNLISGERFLRTQIASSLYVGSILYVLKDFDGWMNV